MITLSSEQLLMLQGKICPYCKKPTELVDSSVIYKGHSFGNIYLCRECDAYVGCHKGSSQSLGRVADARLRHAKRIAHSYFDRIWKEGYMNRSTAYDWLSLRLGVPKEYTHIGMFKVETCNKVVEVSVEFLKSRGVL